MNPPFSILSADVTDRELGETVSAAIEAYLVMDDLPSDKDIEKVGQELLEVVGVRDGRAFDCGASLVVVQEKHGQWSIEPWRRDRGMFFPLREDLFINLSDPVAEDIGVAVKKAFAVLHGFD